MKKKPRIAAISLSWNARDDLKKVLECAKRQTLRPEKIIIVDSGSQDGTEAMIRKEFPLVEFHALGKNIGYAAGYNVAFSLVPAHIDYVVVLDQDITFDKDYIKKIIERFDQEPESTAVLMCDLEEPLVKTFALKEGYINAYHGSCFSYRNKIKKLMRYDEKFFAYENEADLCARLLNSGFRILYYPACKTIHKKDSTKMNPFRTYYQTRNSLWGWWKNSRLTDAILASFINMGIFYSKASKYRVLPAYFRGVFHAFLGLPYCIRNRNVCAHLSYKDLDDVRKISTILEKTRTKPLFKFFDDLYEKSKRI